MPTAASATAATPNHSISVIPNCCRLSVEPTRSDTRSMSTAICGSSLRASSRIADRSEGESPAERVDDDRLPSGRALSSVV